MTLLQLAIKSKIQFNLITLIVQKLGKGTIQTRSCRFRYQQKKL